MRADRRRASKDVGNIFGAEKRTAFCSELTFDSPPSTPLLTSAPIGTGECKVVPLNA